MGTPAQNRKFLVMVAGFFVVGGIFVVCVGVFMIALKALGVVAPTPPVAMGADAGEAGARKTPLANLSVTFHETAPSASYDLAIDAKRTLTCTHDDGVTATTKTCAFELAPLEAELTTHDLASSDAGATRFDLHVASSSLNVDASGDPTNTTTKPLIAELEKLCALATAKTAPFEIVYSRVEQGGTAGKHEIIDLRSDGAFTVKDAFLKPLRSGTAAIVEIAPLARLVARPELAALGKTYVDPTPPPSMMEVDYDITISKTTSLKGVFHDRTPAIIGAITGEVMRVTVYSTP